MSSNTASRMQMSDGPDSDDESGSCPDLVESSEEEKQEEKEEEPPKDPKEEAAEWKAKGNAAYSDKRYQESIDLYSKAIALDPENHIYRGNRAAAYVMVRKFEQAAVDAMKAIDIDRHYVKGYLRAGKAYLSLGNMIEGNRVLKKGIVMDPNNKELRKEMENAEQGTKLYEAAKKAFAQKQWGSAVGYADRALGFIEYWPVARVLKAEAMLELKQYAKVGNDMASLIREDGSNAEALYLRGTALYYQGNFAQAESHVRNALQSDPDYSKARVQLKKIRGLERNKKAGNDAFGKGQWQEAYDAYTEALKLDPAYDSVNATLYANRAAALKNMRKFDEAIADLDKALERNANYTKALLRRAECYKQKEQWQEVVRDLDAAQRLDPENREIKRDLRTAKTELKKSKRKDYYKILECSKHADSVTIKKAYRKAALKWHPDKHGTGEAREKAEQMFKDVNEAYALLSDEDKRAKYDRGMDLEDIEQGGHDFGGHGGVDPNELFAQFFGGGMGGGFGGGGFGGRGGGGFPF